MTDLICAQCRTPEPGHQPCCLSHAVAQCCDCYRRTHPVVGACCARDARAHVIPAHGLPCARCGYPAAHTEVRDVRHVYHLDMRLPPCVLPRLEET